MLVDARSKKLIKWLEGTNWPDGFTWDLSVEMVKNYIAQKLTIKYELETYKVFLNPDRLTRSDYDAIIEIAIKNMLDSGKIWTKDK